MVETYDSDYRQTIAVSRETLGSLKIPVSDTVGDELKTIITAQRPDQTPVSIEVVRLADGRTQVGIRTGPLGVTELDTSSRIQEQIRDRLARKPQRDGRVAEATPLRFPPDEPARTASAKAETESARRKPVSAAARAGSPAVTVYFDQGSNDLRESEHSKLDHLAAALTARPRATVTVNGYADPTGPADYNRIVSESRASTVKMYLVGKGVDAARIRVIGHGARYFVAAEYRPRAAVEPPGRDRLRCAVMTLRLPTVS